MNGKCWVISKSDLRASGLRHLLSRHGLQTQLHFSPWPCCMYTTYSWVCPPWATFCPSDQWRGREPEPPTRWFPSSWYHQVGLFLSGCLRCFLPVLPPTNYNSFLFKNLLKALVLLQTTIIRNESSLEGTSSWSLAYFLMVLATE